MTDWLLLDSARRLLADKCTHEAVQAAEAAGWSATVWAALQDSGYGELTSITIEDAAALLSIAGEHAAPVPLAEAALAGWLLGVPVTPTASVAQADAELRLGKDGLSGTLRRVPWGRAADRVVTVIDGNAVLVATAAATRIERETNLAGEPRDTLVFDDVNPEDVRPAACDLCERGALTRVAMMAGALTAMARLAIAYAGQRRQFGRPVASFQAVQQHLVTIAQDASLVAVAAELAARAAQRGRALFEIAAAKTLASQAALTATRAAHQVHGAIGMTQEYRLHHYTRRLWAWRTEYGDEQHWARWLGRAVCAAGADLLYPAITGGSAVIG